MDNDCVIIENFDSNKAKWIKEHGFEITEEWCVYPVGWRDDPEYPLFQDAYKTKTGEPLIKTLGMPLALWYRKGKRLYLMNRHIDILAYYHGELDNTLRDYENSKSIMIEDLEIKLIPD